MPLLLSWLRSSGSSSSSSNSDNGDGDDNSDNDDDKREYFEFRRMRKNARPFSNSNEKWVKNRVFLVYFSCVSRVLFVVALWRPRSNFFLFILAFGVSPLSQQ